MAECIRTFPTVAFPATLLLRREEVETGKATGASIIAPLHHGGGRTNKAYVEAPFDLMYGFRGQHYGVQFLSPYEMIMHWSMEKIHPPTIRGPNLRSEFTASGLEYNQSCKNNSDAPTFLPGKHYVATEGSDRILLPNVQVLQGLHHRWYKKHRSNGERKRIVMP